MCFSEKSYYFLLLTQVRFLFTNELSASGIVVLCSDQKFMNVSHEKIDIKIKITIFFKNRIEFDRNFKKADSWPDYMLHLIILQWNV